MNMKYTAFILSAFLCTANLYASNQAIATENNITVQNQWKGKKIAYLGDSITDKIHVGTSKNYWQYLEEKLGIEPWVYGINGHQWSDLLGQAQKLKEEKDVVILAHYYVDGQVQELADYVGDSYYLAKVATKVKEKNILFCGVSFMGESAKLLNPGKKVVMADENADCPMAHMVTVERIAEVRKEYDGDVAVVCYVNSTAEIKAEMERDRRLVLSVMMN